MTQDKPLCYAPFIGMYATTTNQYAPCCVSKKWLDTDPETFWSSEKIQKIRKQLLDGKWPDTCSYCKIKQEKKLKSEVDLWDKYYSNYANNVELSIEYGNELKHPMLLDYRTSNTCNLKCRMCSPNFSSKIEEEAKNNPELQKWLYLKNKKSNNYNDFINYTKDLNLSIIKIMGGEPTIDTNVIRFLEHIIEAHDKKPILRFTTNGTNLNKRFQKIMEEYDDVRVAFSVDGTDDTFEYIRTNSNWKKVKKNIENIFEKKLCTDYGFNVVLMPYNIFNIKELLDWFYTLYIRGYCFYIYFSTSDINYTSLKAVLKEDIDQAIKDIKIWLSDKEDFANSIDGISELLSLLEKTNFCKDSYYQFKEFNNLLDKIRKTQLLLLNKKFGKYV